MRVPTRLRQGSRREIAQGPFEGRRAARFTVAAFALFVAVLGLWAMANPLMAGPDEPSHAARAAATVRGDLVGTAVDGSSTTRGVTVPAVFEQAFALTCFTESPHATALCQPALPYVQGDRDVEIEATAGGPAYYLLVGLPSLVVDSTKVFHLMRAVSLLATAAFLALALGAAVPRSRPLTIAGFVLAMTPTMFFLGSVVNPAGLGTAAALALWSTGFAVVGRLMRDERPGRLGVGLVVSAAAVALVLPYGPLWLLAIATAVVVVARPGRDVLARAAAGGRRRVAVAIVVLAGALGVVGSVFSPAGTWSSDAVVRLDELASFLHFVVFESQSLVVGNLASLSWGEFTIPAWFVVVYLGIIASLILWLVVVGRLRARLVLAGLGVGIFSLLAVVRAAGFEAGPDGWGAVDYLPLLLGVPIVLGLALRDPDPALGGERIVFGPRTFLVAWSTLQLAAFAINLHRHVKGANGSWFLTLPGEWPPPVSWYLLMVLYGLALAGLTTLVSRAVVRERVVEHGTEVSA